MSTEITAPLHFRTLLNAHTHLIADFYATWCPPCKTIAPLFAQLSKEHSTAGKIAFVKVNVDEQREVAAQYGVRAMPTFLVFKEGKVVEEVRGADVGGLRRVVEKVKNEAAVETKAEKREGGKEKVEQQSEKGKAEKEGGEEKTVSGSYGMTGGNNWKMSLT
jgi:thioredoxin 1